MDETSAGHCPSCGGEFEPGFTTCPDCGVPLVNALVATENDLASGPTDP